MKKNFLLLFVFYCFYLISGVSFAKSSSNIFKALDEITNTNGSFYYNYFDGTPLFGRSNSHQYLNQDDVIISFEDYMDLNEFPSTDEFIVFLQQVIFRECSGNYLYSKCHMNYYRHALNILRSNNRIDNVFYLIVWDRIRNYKASFKDLSVYLRSLKSLYLKRLSELDEDQSSINDISFLHTRSLSQSFLSYKGLTPRQVLHLKYDSFQIKYLAFQLKKMINVMNSENAYIHVDMEDEDINDIHLKLSYTEKYRLGVKLLKFHLNELQFDSRFGFKPKYIDVLLAGVETGVISPDLLQDFYTMPEFFDSYRNRYSIYKEALKRIGKQILINTPIVGQIAFIPIMIIEMRNELRSGARNEANDTHLF